MTVRTPEPRQAEPIARPQLSAAEVLADVAKTVNAGARPLDEVLCHVVARTRDLLGADRASILLLDDDGRLQPAVSVAGRDDERTYRRFRTMPPIPTETSPAQQRALARGVAVAVDDAGSSALVPPSWREAFALESLAFVPLQGGGRPCGVLVVDSARPRRFAAPDLAVLEGIAASTSTAVRDARDYAAALIRARRLEQVVAVTARLNASPGLAPTLATAVTALTEIFAADSCSVNTLEYGEGGEPVSFTTLASHGPGQPPVGRHAFTDVDPAHVDALRARWSVEPTAPVVYDVGVRPTPAGPFAGLDAAASGVVLPLSQEQRVRGFAVVGRASGQPPTPDMLALGAMVAGQVWLALERARLTADLERRLAQAQLLHGLADDLSLETDLHPVTEHLAGAIAQATGGALRDITLVDRAAARGFGAATPSGEVRTAIRRWRATDRPQIVLIEGVLAVPMVLEGQVIGVLRVAPVDGRLPVPHDQVFLLSLAEGLADVLARTVLRERVTVTERELAVAEERERLARDLHVTVGRRLADAAARLDAAARRPADRVLRSELVAAGHAIGDARVQMREAIHALSGARGAYRGLGAAVRDQGRMLAASSGAAVDVKVVGAPRPLPPSHEGALLRVAHEALANVERHSRASAVCVRLRYCADRVELSVRDNGVGLGQRAALEGLHAGLRTIRARLGEIGGVVTVQAAEDRGFRLEAVVPLPLPAAEGLGRVPTGTTRERR